MKDHLFININNFNGPLDLLLELIRDKKQDIMSINLVELANDYIRIIDQVKNSNLEIAGEYLVMAATLMQIKVKSLITEEEPEELKIEKERLLKTILEYQQFKEIALEMQKLETKRQDIFIKKISDQSAFVPEIDKTKLDGTTSISKLNQIMFQMFERIHAEKLRKITIKNVEISPAEQVIFIKQLFIHNQELDFEHILDNLPTIEHFVITVLALLDMARKEEIILEQQEQFDKIIIRKGPLYEK